MDKEEERVNHCQCWEFDDRCRRPHTSPRSTGAVTIATSIVAPNRNLRTRIREKEIATSPSSRSAAQAAQPDCAGRSADRARRVGARLTRACRQRVRLTQAVWAALRLLADTSGSLC
jgi:hypothetical protein